MAIQDKVVDAAKEVNSKFEGEIDPLINKWSKSKVSGWIAAGFGVALLVIGFIASKVF